MLELGETLELGLTELDGETDADGEDAEAFISTPITPSSESEEKVQFTVVSLSFLNSVSRPKLPSVVSLTAETVANPVPAVGSVVPFDTPQHPYVALLALPNAARVAVIEVTAV